MHLHRILSGEIYVICYRKVVWPSGILLWVWATARLIASGGQPDALLATNRGNAYKFTAPKDPPLYKRSWAERTLGGGIVIARAAFA